VFVIAENFVCGACIEVREGCTAPPDLKDFRGEAAPGLLPANPLQPLFGGSAYAVVTDSPAAAASSRTNFSAGGSLMLSGMGLP
jgi:hypothetical protein